MALSKLITMNEGKSYQLNIVPYMLKDMSS